jgi:hypothetical protein
MPFSDEVAAQSKTRVNKCKMCMILQPLDPEERQEIESVLKDNSIATSPICRALNARGYEVGETNLRKHRENCVL